MEENLLEGILRHMEGREVIQENQQGFTKGKFCLTNLVAFDHDATASMDNRRDTDVTYLDISKAFEMVPHNNLLSKLERYRFDRWAVQWVKNWLQNRLQRAVSMLNVWIENSDEWYPPEISSGTNTL